MRQTVRALGLASSFVAAAAVSASAQSAAAEPDRPPEFMTRFDYRIVANALSGEDPHFGWDTHWGGDFDVVDYFYGRLTFYADYQSILGDEFRPFDPYQSNYYLSASASFRHGSTEGLLLFHHVSRHLSDRPKRDPVAWNAWIVRGLKQVDWGPVAFNLKGNIGPVVARAWVDYTWLGNVEVVARRSISPAVGVYALGFGETFGVDEDLAGRGQQWGGRIEGGVRLTGRGGALDLFAGFERMIDAHPLDRLTRQWAVAGIRLTGM